MMFFYNNNIAMRNVKITDIAPGIVAPGKIDGIYYPHGSFMYIGNTANAATPLNFKFSVSSDTLERSIIREAEVKVIFDEQGWSIMAAKLQAHPDVKVLAPREILLLTDTVLITNVTFPAATRIPIYVGFSFLIAEVSEVDHYKYHVRQYLSSDSSLLGGVHYEINRYQRNPFRANAGDDKEILAGESVSINSIPINESAIYNWYDSDGNLIHEGTGFTVSPDITRKYRLEVITDSDGFKDYDEMEVKVNPFWIESLSPNPAQNQVNVVYQAEDASSAYLMIMNQTGTISQNYIIDTSQSSQLIDVTSYNNGTYTVILVCDGVARDAKNLVIQ